jgi:hypothetical protein
MLTDGNTLTGGLTGSHVPLPGPRPIRETRKPTGFDWGATTRPDPDARKRVAELKAAKKAEEQAKRELERKRRSAMRRSKTPGERRGVPLRPEVIAAIVADRAAGKTVAQTAIDQCVAWASVSRYGNPRAVREYLASKEE